MWLWLLITALSAIIYYVRQHYSIWERKNFPYIKPSIPAGNLGNVTRQKTSFGMAVYEMYKMSTEKIVGVYMFFKPAILVRDAELVQQILTNDFASFHDRGIYVDEQNDPSSANLFSLQGESWKSLRNKLSPAFSSGKLKGMFSTVDDVGDKMLRHLLERIGEKQSVEIEMKEVTTTYAIDVIGSVIFGLDVDSFSNPQNEFRDLSRTVFLRRGILNVIVGICTFTCPPIVKFITRLGFADPIQLAFKDIVQRTIDFREKHNVVRRDLMHLFIQLRNTGKISDDNDEVWNVETEAASLKSMSIESIASNGFLFYIAGSETTAATAAFALYEFAMYPHILQRVQNEVLEVLAKHGLEPNDKYTYEALQDMKYLDLCLMETLRKYPGLPFLNRECTQDFQVPGTKYTIEKGTMILISLFGLQRDPEHFPNPDVFDPERFVEGTKNYNANAYAPFGDGPRHCIAMRMGKVNSKLCIAKVLANFNVEQLPRQELEFIYDSAPIFIPKDGVKMRLSRRITAVVT